MYKHWRKNKRQIEMTITYLNRFHVNALRREQKLSEICLDNIYSKIMLILWVSLAEVQFNLLVTENEHFTKTFLESTDISNKSEVGKWLALIDYFFKDRYFRKQDRELNVLNLGDTNYHRYETLVKVVTEDLKIFIELRNRLAHGQWAVAFNYTYLEKNQTLTNHIWRLSKKDIMLLKAFIANLPPLLELLITSRETFERDYDKYMHRIIKAKNDADLKFEWIKKQRPTADFLTY
jgi:hypothetical protein